MTWKSVEHNMTIYMLEQQLMAFYSQVRPGKNTLPHLVNAITTITHQAEATFSSVETH